MKIKPFPFFPVLLCLLLLLFMPNTASALTRVVVTSTSLCPADQILNPCYTSLSTAVTNAVAGDSIEIRPGTYNVSNLSINKNLTIYGLTKAATILNGSGASAAILLLENIVGTITIKNLTFSNSATGIVVNNTTAQIWNNIFELGTSSTAIQTSNSAASTIENNTFFQNGIGISSGTLNLNINNNIFYQTAGATAITPSNMDLGTILNNLFFQGSIGPVGMLVATTMPISADPVASDPNWKGNIAGLDPLFVDTTPANVALRDFHLMAGTPCQDTGIDGGIDSVDTTRTDIGAYGGGSSDTIPFPVSGLASSASSTAPTTVTLTWTANNAYTIKGYNIYYGYASGVYDGVDAIISGGTATSPSPIDAGNATTASLIVSNAAVTAAPPTLNNPSPLNSSLKLSWSQVAGATGYTIYYSLASAPTLTFPVISVSGGATTTYTLSGLVNGELYHVLVKSISQATYYFAVTAYDTNTAAGTPGTAHESAYSDEAIVPVGATAESGPSNVVTGMPEPITPLPDLPNTGCFIATAAYGSPLAPAVQVLREFRDRFLITNTPGRAFVKWYYASGPAAARYLNEHPALKPLARAALAPAVAAAFFVTRAAPAIQTTVLLALALMAAAWYRRSRAHISSKESPQ